jgi:hypothetical protein
MPMIDVSACPFWPKYENRRPQTVYACELPHRLRQQLQIVDSINQESGRDHPASDLICVYPGANERCAQSVACPLSKRSTSRERQRNINLLIMHLRQFCGRHIGHCRRRRFDQDQLRDRRANYSSSVPSTLSVAALTKYIRVQAMQVTGS